MAKIQPSVLNLTFEQDAGSTNYIDLSQCASIVNRRFYRQGLNWVVGGFTLTTPANTTGTVTIAKLPQTWVCSNAWHKTYAHWKQQQDDAMKEAGGQSAIAKFRDFKIYANVAHVIAGFVGGNLIPRDLDGAEYIKGEWQSSQIVLPNVMPDASGSDVEPFQYFLHMVGLNNTAGSRGMIDGYANSRAYPQSPDPVGPNLASASNFFMQMENVGNESPEVVDQATGKNDDLPYDQDDYPGGDVQAPWLELVHRITLVSSVNSTTRQLSGTNAPCGLFEIANGSDAVLGIHVHLVPGPARGYLTQPMQDM